MYTGVSQSLYDVWCYKRLNAEAVIRTRWRLIYQTLQRFANMQNDATLSLNFCLENSSLSLKWLCQHVTFNTIIFRWNKYFKIFSINFFFSQLTFDAVNRNIKSSLEASTICETVTGFWEETKSTDLASQNCSVFLISDIKIFFFQHCILQFKRTNVKKVIKSKKKSTTKPGMCFFLRLHFLICNW